MSDMIIYRIKLPEEQDTEAFVKFMRDEYLPAVWKGPTRAYAVDGLSLLEKQHSESMYGFSCTWVGSFTSNLVSELRKKCNATSNLLGYV